MPPAPGKDRRHPPLSYVIRRYLPLSAVECGLLVRPGRVGVDGVGELREVGDAEGVDRRGGDVPLGEPDQVLRPQQAYPLGDDAGADVGTLDAAA